MGSIFAHETGLPLKIPMNTANRKDTDRFFYQKVKALPDILKDNGYKSYVVCGGDTKFSGVNYYYQDHGDYQIYDYNHYKEMACYLLIILCGGDMKIERYTSTLKKSF